MKIALPSHGNQIDDHFGHCEYFTVFTVNMDTKQITNREIVPSPEGCGCKSNIASVLKDMGVTLMLAGNMGEGAVKVLKNSEIDVLRGCSGDVKDTAIKWINGSLVDSGDCCHEHEHGCQH
ncbi:dinitrogenase iron-molybdenum cofactor biosynthesis protein [Clostridium fermenticellae]|uniref:Dinitrogenase iron-molybdenum cofactor biosynthesis protein n=1 Tax=Clostridium fermenticellae TaxID=2068654 RepID=A0A386H351_9CLOT|nr:NifB/NifX family molybdenum-iron cluster-binding protein [Clostridium fermenticellae]AYD40110.1 dinitrogenase iron-molybdenum cofactor biosynthesis protein [Clostridium fermenticellae]